MFWWVSVHRVARKQQFCETYGSFLCWISMNCTTWLFDLNKLVHIRHVTVNTLGILCFIVFIENSKTIALIFCNLLCNKAYFAPSCRKVAVNYRFGALIFIHQSKQIWLFIAEVCAWSKSRASQQSTWFWSIKQHFIVKLNQKLHVSLKLFRKWLIAFYRISILQNSILIDPTLLEISKWSILEIFFFAVFIDCTFKLTIKRIDKSIIIFRILNWFRDYPQRGTQGSSVVILLCLLLNQ